MTKNTYSIIVFLLFIAVPILYYIIGYKPNIILDIIWVYSFAVITKDFIMKVILKKKYCEVKFDNVKKAKDEDN
jgi:hypothetical protein